MLRIFNIENGMLRERAVEGPDLKSAITAASWVDVYEASEPESDLLEGLLRTELPETEDVEEIEASARYFVDSAGIHVHSLFLSQSEGRHSTVTVACILQPHRLITIRESELADFRLLRMRARRGQVEAYSPQELLVNLFEQKVENMADQLEYIHHKLE